MKTAWLSCEVLSWNLQPQGQEELDNADLNRAYEHLAHADKLLALAGADDMYLVDVITPLKRCLNQRLVLLNRLYDFSSVPIHDRPKRLLDQLAAFDLVRPLLLQHLFEIRNAVEHKDAHPPTRQRCGELVDVLWYFLRSTDFLVRRRTFDFILECPNAASGEESPHFIEVRALENRPWHFAFSGLIPPGILSPEEVREWLQLELLDRRSYSRLVHPLLYQNPEIVHFLDALDSAASKRQLPRGYQLNAKLVGPLYAREAMSRLWIRTL